MSVIGTNNQLYSSKFLSHATGGFTLSTDDTYSSLAIGK